MKYAIPERMPCRSEFLTAFLDAIFPDLDALHCTRTGYGYTAACEQAAREAGLFSDALAENGLPEDSDVFRLLYEMAQSSEAIFGRTPNLLTDRAYARYSDTLFTFCDQDSGSLKGWLKQTGSSNRVNKSFDAALFFTFLLLRRPACAQERRPFFEKCLGYVGITDVEDAVCCKLFRFDWAQLGGRGTAGAKSFTRLANSASILLGAVTLTIFEMIGTYNAQRDGAKIEKLHGMFAQTFARESQAFCAMERAERACFNDNRFFEPRSIQTVKKLYPQDFFVLPEFEHGGEKSASPLSRIGTSAKSARLLVVAKTGLGKSAFLQMATLCMLCERCAAGETDAALQAISEQLDAPKGLFVISVPARMFSFCYRDERYRPWTSDFVSLFFQCMWKLSGSFNFYSSQSAPRFSAAAEPQTQQDALTPELADYVQELARTGKLLLILDSFDEISSGEMRAAYLQALEAFYDKYCCYPEAGESGAHVIVSSREMSPRTMDSLARALALEPGENRYAIRPLNRRQREALVLNWHRFLRVPNEESREILAQIESNHYYLDYSVNPYMLSVVCFYFGHDLGGITQRFINTLADRMLKNNRSADPVLYDVLMNIVKLLQDVAAETVTGGNPHFSRQKLDKHLIRLIDKTDLTEQDVEAYVERLHEIFVTQVGLIVPADGADSDYQFINGQIRFELAAKGMQRALESDEKAAGGRLALLASIADTEEYAGLLVPLLCGVNLENVRLAQQLVTDLVMRDFKTDADERILVRAMLDLLLNRYASNIATAAAPGDRDAQYVRRAQRLLLMRLLTSRNFRPTAAEKAALAHSPAFIGNAAWFSDDAASRLQ